MRLARDSRESCLGDVIKQCCGERMARPAMLKVSAPGKVILFGDHSVVYGRQAIAAALSLRTCLTFKAWEASENGASRRVRLIFPDVGLDEEIDVSRLSGESCNVDEPTSDLDAGLVSSIGVALSGLNLPDVALAAATAFAYLFCRIVDVGHTTACLGEYRITSQLPIGAGLGSSASVSVIIATALLILVDKVQLPDCLNAEERLAALSRINRWAYVGEQVIHGTPSGVDNTVATYGRGLAFRKGQAHRTIAMPLLPLLLTDTGVPRSTKTQVANVAARREALPAVIEPILDAMHGVAVAAEVLLSDSTGSLSVPELGRLIEMNQCMLGSLGVSHPAIEAVITRNRGLGHTKLVGAGGGGCVITLLNPGITASSASVHRAPDHESLEQTYDVTLGGSGVGIHISDADAPTGETMQYYA